ncbi:MAG: CDP-alcohol phosphatidyltransferase family protein [Desulfobacterales bacterium]|nr:CDP-alcohol phosphatidyltransferase family protein [Desulfobacterales bacterium]
MPDKNAPPPRLHLPNLLSCFRLVAAPGLLYLAWTGEQGPFLTLLGASLLSDAVDGFLARKMGMVSELGARLDSWGDLAMYMTALLGAWWLWPEVITREIFFVMLAVSSYLIPLLFGFFKFKRLPSYHTWAGKTAALLTAPALLVLLITDIGWPFRSAAIVCALAAGEEIAITLRLRQWQCDIPSLWHLVRQGPDRKKHSQG